MESRKLFEVLVDYPDLSRLLKGDIVRPILGSEIYYNVLHSECLREYSADSIWYISDKHLQEITLTDLEKVIYDIK